MKNSDYSVVVIDKKNIDSIRPFWEELNAHHAELSQHFSPHFHAMTFERRKAQFLEKAQIGQLLITACVYPQGGDIVGYCVSNIVKTVGEIDSLFVKQEHRGSGVGTLLVESAIAWMQSQGIAEISVHVLVGNEGALNFYRKFGLFPRLLLLTNKNFPT
jgi:diamine N-acetyltransferase